MEYTTTPPRLLQPGLLSWQEAMVCRFMANHLVTSIHAVFADCTPAGVIECTAALEKMDLDGLIKVRLSHTPYGRYQWDIRLEVIDYKAIMNLLRSNNHLSL